MPKSCQLAPGCACSVPSAYRTRTKNRNDESPPLLMNAESFMPAPRESRLQTVQKQWSPSCTSPNVFVSQTKYHYLWRRLFGLVCNCETKITAASVLKLQSDWTFTPRRQRRVTSKLQLQALVYDILPSECRSPQDDQCTEKRERERERDRQTDRQTDQNAQGLKRHLPIFF